MLFWKDVGNGILLDRPLPFKLHQSYRTAAAFYSGILFGTAAGMQTSTLVLVSGPDAGSSLLPRNACDGLTGLGSGHEWPPCPRSVEQSPSHVAHHLPGDAGSVSSSETLSPDLRDVMYWYAPTTQRWSLISTTREDYVRVPCTSWRTWSCLVPGQLLSLSMEITSGGISFYKRRVWSLTPARSCGSCGLWPLRGHSS